jgi:adenosine kinase
MNIFVSGSLAYDNIMDFPDDFRNHILPDKVHNINLSFLVDKLKVNYGGTAGNIAYNLALLGEKPIVLATAGRDFDKYKEWLSRNGVNVSYVKIIKEESTAVAYIITDKSDNQIAAFYPGAMKYLGLDLESSLLTKDSLAIVAPGGMGDMMKYLVIYKKNKIPYIFDPSQQIPALTSNQIKEGITGAKVLISNDYELSLISEKTGWTQTDIIGKIEILVTTIGAKGSVIKSKGKTYTIPAAKPKKIKDPTGAGDAYRAGFLKGLIAGLSLDKIGRLASVVAVYAVETYGTQNHKFTWQDIQNRYFKNYSERI